MWENIIYILIGAVISLATTLIIKLIDYKANRIGKYEIYIKDISQDVLTIKLQIKNTTNSVKYIRDLKICKIDIENKKEELFQFDYSKTTQDGQTISETEYGEKGSYSFIVSEKLFKNIVCMFKHKDFDFNNSDYILQYYDELDNLIVYPIPNLEKYKWFKLSVN